MHLCDVTGCEILGLKEVFINLPDDVSYTY